MRLLGEVCVYVHHINHFLGKLAAWAHKPREAQQQQPCVDNIQFAVCSTENYGIAFYVLKNAFRNL